MEDKKIYTIHLKWYSHLLKNRKIYDINGKPFVDRNFLQKLKTKLFLKRLKMKRKRKYIIPS